MLRTISFFPQTARKQAENFKDFAEDIRLYAKAKGFVKSRKEAEGFDPLGIFPDGFFYPNELEILNPPEVPSELLPSQGTILGQVKEAAALVNPGKILGAAAAGGAIGTFLGATAIHQQPFGLAKKEPKWFKRGVTIGAGLAGAALGYRLERAKQIEDIQKVVGSKVKVPFEKWLIKGAITGTPVERGRAALELARRNISGTALFNEWYNALKNGPEYFRRFAMAAGMTESEAMAAYRELIDKNVIEKPDQLERVLNKYIRKSLSKGKSPMDIVEEIGKKGKAPTIESYFRRLGQGKISPGNAPKTLWERTKEIIRGRSSTPELIPTMREEAPRPTGGIGAFLKKPETWLTFGAGAAIGKGLKKKEPERRPGVVITTY